MRKKEKFYRTYRGKAPIGRRIGIVLLALAGLAAVLCALCLINHRMRLGAEAALLVPPGELVEVEGGRMHVYTEGDGPATLVFLSGGGTCAPVLDFQSLYSLLSDTYRIAVVEKFGYGFSDVSSRPRDIDTILEDTRQALAAAGVEGPYVLCPHSMSGLEAIRWAQTYPEEVTAVIGLDMAVPASYDGMEINMAGLRLAQLALRAGIVRLLPYAAQSDAVQHGTLSERDKAVYEALFYRRSATADMLSEAAAVKENARTVADGGTPQVPMLLFLSDGTGGAGFSREQWRGLQKGYLAGVENGGYVELDCPHYVHDYEYQRISQEIRAFLPALTA